VAGAARAEHAEGWLIEIEPPLTLSLSLGTELVAAVQHLHRRPRSVPQVDVVHLPR
jgi:hypothetical protein